MTSQFCDDLSCWERCTRGLSGPWSTFTSQAHLVQRVYSLPISDAMITLLIWVTHCCCVLKPTVKWHWVSFSVSLSVEARSVLPFLTTITLHGPLSWSYVTLTVNIQGKRRSKPRRTLLGRDDILTSIINLVFFQWLSIIFVNVIFVQSTARYWWSILLLLVEIWGRDPWVLPVGHSHLVLSLLLMVVFIGGLSGEVGWWCLVEVFIFL